jgi:hypothetical protein
VTIERAGAMVARKWCISGLVLLIASTACDAAPRISPSDQPGRERQRFIDPPGFREIAPRPPLLIPDSGVKPRSKRKCRARKPGKRRSC